MYVAFVMDLFARPGLLAWDLLFTGYYPVLQWTGGRSG